MKNWKLYAVAVAMVMIACLSVPTLSIADSDCPECDVLQAAQSTLSLDSDVYESSLPQPVPSYSPPPVVAYASPLQSYGSNGGSSSGTFNPRPVQSYGSNGGSPSTARTVRGPVKVITVKRPVQSYGSDGSSSSGFTEQRFKVRQGIFGRTVIRPIR